MEFSKTIGHQKLKALFLRVIGNGKLAHAYTLVGPEHVGKTTFAAELASLLRADPVLDLAVYDSSEDFSIEQARELQTRLSLTPAGDWKVAVIARAEQMSQGAANSLLKLLEEPPAHSLLVLITSNFYALLPTIASRVLRVNFSLADQEATEASLRGYALPQQLRRQILRFAQGRPGLARNLAENPALLEFYGAAEKHFQVLQKGTAGNKLLAAQAVAALDDAQIREIVVYAMRRWVEEIGALPLAEKLQRAYRDLQYNVNTKLLMDGLFL